MRTVRVLLLHVAVTAALAVALSSCSFVERHGSLMPGILPPTSGSRVEVDCTRASKAPDNCFSQAEAQAALAMAAEVIPGFNSHMLLVLEVWPYGQIIYGRSWAETPSSSRIRLSRLRDLPHELFHLQDWRTAAGRDDKHPPVVDPVTQRVSRPWLDPARNVQQAELQAAYAATFGATR